MQKKFYQSANFWTSIALLIAAFLKATDYPLFSDLVENIILIVSVTIATINMISKIEWSQISWTNPFGGSANSTNFFVQLYSTLTLTLPFIAAYVSQSDFVSILNTAFSGNWSALVSMIVALVIKIFSSVNKSKTDPVIEVPK